MAKKRYINTKFWSDNYISDLDPIEKLLFIYFITNPYTDICGVYEISLKQIALDTGIDKQEMLPKIINRFSRDKKIYYIDGWIYVKNFAKHQAENESVKKGIERSLGDVPEHIMAKISEIDTACIQPVTASPPPASNLDLDLDLTKPKPILRENAQQKTEKFILEVKKIVSGKDVPESEIMKFCSYWTEPNKSKTKLRWELQPTFDIQRRLGTWFRNNREFSVNKIIEIPE